MYPGHFFLMYCLRSARLLKSTPVCNLHAIYNVQEENPLAKQDRKSVCTTSSVHQKYCHIILYVCIELYRHI